MYATASCTVMTKLLNGDIAVDSGSITDVTDTLKKLSEDGPGEVKTTARFVLEGKRSNSETEEQVEKFKEYCRNYVG